MSQESHNLLKEIAREVSGTSEWRTDEAKPKTSNINIRASEDLIKRFKLECESSGNKPSTILRRWMLSYITTDYNDKVVEKEEPNNTKFFNIRLNPRSANSFKEKCLAEDKTQSEVFTKLIELWVNGEIKI